MENIFYSPILKNRNYRLKAFLSGKQTSIFETTDLSRPIRTLIYIL